MTSTKTISVEPAKLTLADRKSKEIANDFLRININKGSERQDLSLASLSLFFPLQKKGFGAIERFFLPLRSIFASLLIVYGVSLFNSDSSAILSPLTVGIVAIVLGACLALGFLARPAMSAAVAVFGLSGILALRAGATDLTAFSLMFGSLVFALSGAGRYSLDFFIRRALIRRNKARKAKMRSEMLSYKAFSIASRNLS